MSIEKIAKILNQAENASTPEEAETFFQTAQALSTKYSIELAIARKHTAKGQKREEPVQRRSDLGTVSKAQNKKMIALFLGISASNDVRCDISKSGAVLYPYGFPQDIDATENLFAVIAPQMVRAANEYIKSGEYKKETTRVWKDYDWHVKPIDGRVARSNFYLAYINRIGSRLRSAKRSVESEAIVASSGTELVLADKKREVADFYRSNSNARGSWSGSKTQGYSRSAALAGSDAAASAKLSETGSIGSRRALNV